MKSGSFLCFVVVLLSLLGLVFGQQDESFYNQVKRGEYQKIGSILGQLVESSRDSEAATNTADRPPLNIGTFEEHLIYSSEDIRKVSITVIYELGTEGYNVVNQIEGMGFEKKICRFNVCEGFAPISVLTAMSSSATVSFIKPNLKPFFNAGLVTSEGDRAMNADFVREQNINLNGFGQKVGVLSDSFNCLGGYATDVGTSDLPPDVQVLKEDPGCSSGSDEGRAMLQIVKDVAPGSDLAFHTAIGGPLQFADGILVLANAGCTVITDDVTYPTQPWFQDDPVAQAVDTVTAQGIPYTSSAGNEGRHAWHSEIGFVDSGRNFSLAGEDFGKMHDFGDGDVIQNFDLLQGIQYTFVFQWDEPFKSVPNSAGCTNDLDYFIVDPEGSLKSGSIINNIDGDAFEGNVFTADSTGTYGLVITLKEGLAPGYMKWIMRGAIFNIEYPVLSSTLVAHHNAKGGAGVGAANYLDTPRFGTNPPLQQSFSSAGGTPIFFDPQGNRLGESEVRLQPRFVGPDNGINTFFGEGQRFTGTSAAAPHVAALIALMLQQDPSLAPERIFSILEETAIDMNDTGTAGSDPGFDFGTGHGFVDAVAAFKVLVPPTPTAPVPTNAPIINVPTDSPVRSPTVNPPPTLPPRRPPQPILESRGDATASGTNGGGGAAYIGYRGAKDAAWIAY